MIALSSCAAESSSLRHLGLAMYSGERITMQIRMLGRPSRPNHATCQLRSLVNLAVYQLTPAARSMLPTAHMWCSPFPLSVAEA